MSDEKRSVQYDEGEASVVLADGQLAERGKPVEVSTELADKLLEQNIWFEVGKGPAAGAALAHKPQPETEEELREQELAERPEPTDAAKEEAKKDGVDLDKVDGSGGRTGDQVTVSDVKDAAAAEPSPVPPAPDAGDKKQTRR